MKILLYYHTGSKNHGCEAIVRTLCQIFTEDEIILYSFDQESDKEAGLDKLLTVKQCLKRKDKYSILERIKIRLGLYTEGQECYEELINERADWAFAIGGDSYCYPGQPKELAYINFELKKRNIKTALVGCSISEDVVSKRKVKEDLSRYDIILARESLTYEALKKNGLSNISLYPDSAFLLGIKETDTVKLQNDVKYIGINVSPLIVKNESKKNVVYDNYVRLIQYILEQTQYHILLIPHVCVEWDNDLDVLMELYNEFGERDRIVVVPESGCEELKYFISKCSFVVCARTHISIAAYSLGIPTLVVGYSIKSRGIARDLFGDYNEYVLPVTDITSQNSVLDYFIMLFDRSKEIRTELQNKSEEFKIQLKQMKKSITSK